MEYPVQSAAMDQQTFNRVWNELWDAEWSERGRRYYIAWNNGWPAVCVRHAGVLRESRSRRILPALAGN